MNVPTFYLSSRSLQYFVFGEKYIKSFSFSKYESEAIVYWRLYYNSASGNPIASGQVSNGGSLNEDFSAYSGNLLWFGNANNASGMTFRDFKVELK